MVIDQLRQANARLVAASAALAARVAELERRLGKDSSNSSRPPSQDGLGKPPAPPRRRRGGGRAPGKQPGAPGAHLAQVGDPDEVVVHRPERCDGCGGDLTLAPVTGVEARQVFDLPQVRLWVCEHRAERRQCACGQLTAGVFPAAARAAACYGPGVRGLAGYLMVAHHLPVERAARVLGDALGASVSAGTLAGLPAEGAAGLSGFVERVREQLAGAEVAHFDETGARVAGRLHWVHSASTPLLSWFVVHAKRGVAAMDAAGVCQDSAGWRCMTAGRRTGATPRPPTRCARRTCSASWRRSATSRGRGGPPSWPSGFRSPAAKPPWPATPAPTGLSQRSWRAFATATTTSSPRVGLPTPCRHAHLAGAVGSDDHRPRACWSGSASTAARSCDSWPTCGSRPPIIWQSATSAWSSCSKRSPGAGGPWTAPRRS